MLLTTHIVKTTASPKAVWHVWKDVANWHTWDHGIEFSTIEGPFEKGTTGTLKPKGGPLIHTELTSVEPMKAFTHESKLPFSRVIASHFLKEANGKTEVKVQIEIKGLLAPFFACVLGHTIRKKLPEEMKAMIQKAENLKIVK